MEREHSILMMDHAMRENGNKIVWMERALYLKLMDLDFRGNSKKATNMDKAPSTS